MTERYYISSTKYSVRERQTKKNGRVYDVYFRVVDPVTREERQKKLSGFSTKAAAKAGYAEFVTEKCELRKGAKIKKAPEAPATEKTFAELADEYIEYSKTQNKESTVYQKIGYFKNCLVPKYGDKKISFFTKEELYRFQDYIWGLKKGNGEPYSYQSCDHLRKAMSSLLEWCESRYGYPNNMRYVKKPKRRQPKPVMNIWTREEFETFRAALTDERYVALFSFLFFTGQRKGEAMALYAEDVDLENKTVKIYKTVTRKNIDGAPWKVTSTKADKTQTIPLCEPLVKILREYHNGTPFYFGGERPISDHAIAYAFEKGIEKSGVKEIRIHDLRHSFVSMLIHLGANYNVIADLINDTVEQVMNTYGHLYESDKLKVIQKIE